MAVQYLPQVRCEEVSSGCRPPIMRLEMAPMPPDQFGCIRLLLAASRSILPDIVSHDVAAALSIQASQPATAHEPDCYRADHAPASR